LLVAAGLLITCEHNHEDAHPTPSQTPREAITVVRLERAQPRRPKPRPEKVRIEPVLLPEYIEARDLCSRIRRAGFFIYYCWYCDADIVEVFEMRRCHVTLFSGSSSPIFVLARSLFISETELPPTADFQSLTLLPSQDVMIEDERWVADGASPAFFYLPEAGPRSERFVLLTDQVNSRWTPAVSSIRLSEETRSQLSKLYPDRRVRFYGVGIDDFRHGR
jgi:hypothetical protein